VVQTVGAYRLLRQIGEGGMGVVHLALAPDGSRVAVKILRPQVIGGREARQRLEREVAAMRRVRSPRVAECVDAEPWGDPPFVVTRYVAGLSLTEYVAEYGPLDAARLHRFAAGTAEALAGVHAAGVLHRDIKPSNVLIDRDEPVLIDFGLAMSGDESRMTHAGWIFGTPAYLAPEVVVGDAPTPAVDVHGWAATVTFAATGRSPYGSGPSVVVLDRIRRGEFSIGGVPQPMAAVLQRCLSPEPHQRPAASELCRWLDRRGAVAPAGPTLQVPVASAAGGATTSVPTTSAPTTSAPTSGSSAASIHSVGHPWGDPPPVAPGAWRTSSSAQPPTVTAVDRPAPPQQQHPWAPAGPSTGTRVLQWLAGLSCGAALVGAVAVAPYATAGLVALLLAATRAGFATADRRRRLEGRRGPRGRDGFMSVMVWPLRALWAMPVAILACSVSLMAALVLSGLQAVGRGGGAATIVGGLAFAVLLWFGPAHVTLRRAGDLATRAVLTPTVAGVLTVLVLATVALVLLVVATGSPTSWFPLDRAPWRSLGGAL
jgi:serine/threonine protein kinase